MTLKVLERVVAKNSPNVQMVTKIIAIFGGSIFKTEPTRIWPLAKKKFALPLQNERNKVWSSFFSVIST